MVNQFLRKPDGPLDGIDPFISEWWFFFANVGKSGNWAIKGLAGRKQHWILEENTKKLEIIYILNVVTIIINGNLNCTPNVK